MRKTLLFLTLLCTKLTFAQLNDNFADGDFTNNPTWDGNTANFFINGSGQLQSNGPNLANQSIGLSTPNLYAKNAVWEFFIQLNFDPTTSNFPRVYLVSNQADLTGALQGYFFQVGETGTTDGFHLYRQNGTSTTQIITGAQKTRTNANVVSARIKVTRDADGKWELYSDVSGGTNYTLEGAVTDNNYTTTTHFGVNCRYGTASRYNQFIFDDFKITELVPDVTPPSISAIKSTSDKTFELTFNEAVEAASATLNTNYSINGIGSPTTVELLSSSVVRLNYANDVVSGSYTVAVNNVKDAKGNAITTTQTKTFFHVKSYTAKRGDVVFNEIMAAPSSSAVLSKEYFELYNTTDNYIIITGWKYKDGSTSIATFAADTLAPKSYRIVCATADVDLYKPYGKTLGISPWPALNNDKDDLNLFLPDGTTVIDFVSYTDAWYRDNSKRTGYALELINPTGSCGGAFNWTASTGTNNGTPGAQNSVYNPQNVDNVAPKLITATILSPTQIQIDFDKPIATNLLTDVNNYNINNGIGRPTSVALNGTGNQSVVINLLQAIAPNIESLLTVTGIVNCNGIPINPSANTATILVTDPIKPGDILISEILFNERVTGGDFVEVYNATNKILDLKELTISNPAASGSTGPSKRTISSTSAFIRPKTYWVITASADAVKQNYNVPNPSQIIQIASMPTFTNASGKATIWSGDIAIDSLSYNEKLHNALLKVVKGVSLERVSFAKPANDAGNLQSAAASAGFATPTYKNSQSEDESVKSAVTLANKTFSPDNDGFEDQLQIDYRFKGSGNLATINIYTDKGVLVRKLARNITMSTQGSIIWDGLNDSGQLCKVGLYVIRTDIFNINGSTDSFKQTCVLASKLN